MVEVGCGCPLHVRVGVESVPPDLGAAVVQELGVDLADVGGLGVRQEVDPGPLVCPMEPDHGKSSHEDGDVDEDHDGVLVLVSGPPELNWLDPVVFGSPHLLVGVG